MSKKKSLGFKPGTRTADEVNREYHQEGLMVGHKTRLLTEMGEDYDRLTQDYQKQCETLNAEIDEHIVKMRRANLEAKSIPPAPAQNPPSAPTEGEENAG